ncbi:MAG: hypothetical protein PWR20_1635 [Bacteroidales bacterium]|jgi:hypothetical protein|nr:hypothetical protein [Bacteroidales bacterium]MDN5330573.1 hypothetical protein [Bacteroidales bacterium]
MSHKSKKVFSNHMLKFFRQKHLQIIKEYVTCAPVLCGKELSIKQISMI